MDRRPRHRRIATPRSARLLVPLLAVALAVVGCDAGRPADHAPPIASLDTIPSPAAPGSGEPNLTVDPDGVVYLSWLEPTTTGHALRFAALDGDGWGEPRTVIDRPDLFVNWADFPSLAFFDDGVMAAHWLEKSGPGTYAYDVRMALSRDGGATWSDDIIPHRDGVQAEHGFVSLLPFQGRLAALWLDGRATPDGEPMTLRYTTVGADGGLGPELAPDTSVCDCCQTALARTGSGLVATYRNRTAEEVRDIYVARYSDGEWTEGRPVHEDGWVIAACPVNGPAIDARGDTVVVAWFTAAEPGSGEGGEAASGAAGDGAAEDGGSGGGQGRALVAFSRDGGVTFEPPIRVDDGGAMGRVDAVLVDDGALVSWLERTDAGAEVRVRRVTDGPGPALTVTGAEAERATGFPRMVRTGNRVVFAWTRPGEDGGVRTAVGRLPDGPAASETEDE